MSKELSQLWNKVEVLQSSLEAISQRILLFMERTQMSLDNLIREVAETRTVVDSAITLISGLREKLSAAGTDPAKLEELAKELDETQAKLAAALTENTPADPAPSEPAPEPSDPGPEQPPVE